MASGDILSDFGINLLEEEIDDVIFQTNEFLTDATFTGSQGSFWWLLVVTPNKSVFASAIGCRSADCNLLFRKANPKRDKNGTKPQENKAKTFSDRHAPSGSIILSRAKVRICPVKSEKFFLFLSSSIHFPYAVVTADNTNAFYTPGCPFADVDVPENGLRPDSGLADRMNRETRMSVQGIAHI